MTYIPVALRREVITRAGNCCEYCRTPQSAKPFSFHIEHIIAEKHGGQTLPDNLCLSCRACNVHKGSDISSVDDLTEKVETLFHPRRHKWEEHFVLDGVQIRAITPAGRVTVKLLQLNSLERITERDIMISLGIYPC